MSETGRKIIFKKYYLLSYVSLVSLDLKKFRSDAKFLIVKTSSFGVGLGQRIAYQPANQAFPTAKNLIPT